MENIKSNEVHVIIGGCGYIGFKLGETLSKTVLEVRLFDLKEPPNSIKFISNIKFMKGNVTDINQVLSVIRGADCVYHIASYGMSGREQLNKSLIQRVNIGGTENVINACIEANVSRLVYTSTYNVIFGGQIIENGNESMNYWPLKEHPDEYSRTKSQAEQFVINSNGKTLKTCALRLAAVYGPGEERHFPRIVYYLEQGLFLFTYGDAIVDFVHVENVVNAHILAGDALKSGIANGKSYFISDGAPIKNWEFMKRFVIGLGYRYPSTKLPVKFIYFMAMIIELIHLFLSPVYNFQPFLTRAEVYKTGVTHYFNIDKAKVELNYKPTVQNDVHCVVKWFIERGKVRKIQKKYSTLFLFFILILVFFVVFSFLPGVN